MKKILLLLAIAACAAGTHASAQMLDISEVYGGGGNTGAPYTNDFIELFNYGTASIDLSTYTVFYAATAGAFSTTTKTALTGTIAAGQYFLIAEAGGSVGTALPTANVTGTVNLSAANGKVALALSTTAVTAITPGATGVIDFVGYGTANAFEGTAAAPAGSNTTSIQRINPIVDSNQNSIDFTTGTPTPGAAFVAAPVPEPSTYACMIGGLGGLALMRFRRRRA